MLTSWKSRLPYSEIRKRRVKEMTDLVREIVDAEGAIEVSSFPAYYVTPLGDVFSTRAGKFTRLRPGKKPGGYRFVGMTNADGVHYEMVHRIVAKAFINNPRCLHEINHKNGNKDDNRVDNLEWCDRSENVQHAFATGLMDAVAVGPGKRKLTDAEVESIKASEGSCKKTGRAFGVSAQTVCNIRRGYCTRKGPAKLRRVA